MLKPGDPCPCCGEPIKTRDQRLLALLDRIKNDKNFTWTQEDLILLRFKGEECDGCDAG